MSPVYIAFCYAIPTSVRLLGGGAGGVAGTTGGVGVLKFTALYLKIGFWVCLCPIILPLPVLNRLYSIQPFANDLQLAEEFFLCGH